MPTEPVLAWSETVFLPTYPVGQPEKLPLFLEKRVYQGSSGAVYPYPVIESVGDEARPQPYIALFLENRYLKIMILPELGGRVHLALDKTNNRPFVYHNQVIKPALVGLTGPWVSGGIEFNWPQHHRPSTFAPLDWRIVANPDGSQTVWCGEVEVMWRAQEAHGFTLYPDRAYLEIKVQVINRSAQPQTFLWWANPAVAVHDETQSVFPPDVHAVLDHGKRAVSTFPIATGEYYKVNYAPGTDISRYKNIPVPTSYMAYHSDYDFMGDYDHRAQAGMLHIADHHAVPGKKQWTWGSGDFGRVWDRQLTDEDGPYIELMCGAYTDNQPDFTWLQPGEQKAFNQVFMPYKDIGPASNANIDAALHLSIDDGQARLGVYVTRPLRVEVRLLWQGRVVFSASAALSPSIGWTHSLSLPEGAVDHELSLQAWSGEQLLLAYTPPPPGAPAPPPPAQPLPEPAAIAAIEQLYLAGLHLEQYRHATYDPEAYYMEALRRDPGDSRSNLALARRRCAQGQFAQAQAYAAASLARQTAHNANPYDGEASYMLGLTQRLQGRPDEAYDAFAKAAWNAAWQDAACFELARLDARRGDYPAALEHLERALSRNANHHQGRHLQAAVLRAMGRLPEARQAARLGLQRNPFNHGCWWELTGPLAALDASAASAPPAPPQASAPSTPATASQGGDSSANPSLPPFAADGSDSASFGAAGTWPELALDYAHAGFYDEAAAVLRRAAPTALNAYLLGWVQAQAGELSAAQHAWQAAAALSPDYGFPNRLEEVLALQQAVAANPADAHAHYMLGNFWYAHRQYDQAISAWEACAALAPGFAPALRNLGLAAFNHQHDAAAALAYFRRAFELAPHHARLLFELDQLEKRLGVDAQARLDRLNQFDQLTVQRDDLSLERVALLNTLGRPEDAYRMLISRRFHPWEGGEGKTTRQYVAALAEMARRRLDAGRYRAALDLLEQARHYPYSLGEGKLLGVRENHLDYLAGLAWRQVGDETQARGYFERAAAGDYALASAMFYNDQPPEMIYYQGLAQRALGDEAAARRTFQRLVDYAQLHIDDEVKIDYFAVSLPDFLVFEDDLKARNRALCAHLLALGRQGLAGA